MSNRPVSRAAEQITADQLLSATSNAVRRAVKEQESRPQGPLNSVPILVGYIAND
jgi:hypothetical protein